MTLSQNIFTYLSTDNQNIVQSCLDFMESMYIQPPVGDGAAAGDVLLMQHLQARKFIDLQSQNL